MQYVKRDTEELKAQGYHKLIAWKVADDFTLSTYQLTKKFPKNELFGITSQLRRAVLSVPLNIVEGYARNNRNDFRNFLRISLGSLAEVEYLLKISSQLKYIDTNEYESLYKKKERAGKLLWKLMKSQS